MATAANDPGQWRMLWDTAATDMFSIFPDSVLPPDIPMNISPNAFWDFSSTAAEAEGALTQKTSRDISQGYDHQNSNLVPITGQLPYPGQQYAYGGRQQSYSPLSPLDQDPSRQTDYDTRSLSFETEAASPQTDWASSPARKRKSASLEASLDTNSQSSSPARPTKSRRDRERNRVAAAKCRQKAKQSVSHLQDRERELLQQNRFLTAHAGSLREEVINLKNEILRHSHCNSDVIQTYINKAAREIR